MTDKKKAQRRAPSKGKTRQPADGLTPEARLVVTPAEAERLIVQIADAEGDALYANDATVGAFLLLLHSVTYNENPIDREEYVRVAERVLMTCTHAFEDAANKLRQPAAHSVRASASRAPQKGAA